MREVANCDKQTRARDAFELDALLHPSRVYAHPRDVLRDNTLSVNEKRAILASWASDACAVEAAPELRCTANGALVRWDDVMDALRELDRQAIQTKSKSSPKLSAYKPSPWLALCS